MGEIVHTSRVTIVREKGPTRRAMIEGFGEPVYYGVQAALRGFTRSIPKRSMPPHSIIWLPPPPPE